MSFKDLAISVSCCQIQLSLIKAAHLYNLLRCCPGCLQVKVYHLTFSVFIVKPNFLLPIGYQIDFLNCHLPPDHLNHLKAHLDLIHLHHSHHHRHLHPHHLHRHLLQLLFQFIVVLHYYLPFLFYCLFIYFIIIQMINLAVVSLG